MEGRTDLKGASLSFANLNWANFDRVDLNGANINWADLNWANLDGAGLRGVDLTMADLGGTNLGYAVLEESCHKKANLSGSKIYGISAAWDLNLESTIQDGLIISQEGQAEITVDDLGVAQFVYLLLFRPKIGTVIDTITSKAVVILGRFTEERTIVLDALREKLRQRYLVPIIFDCDPPELHDLTEMVRTLAHMDRFIIADITDPKSIPKEWIDIIPDLPSVPIQTVILGSQLEYNTTHGWMYEHWKRFPWVLPLFRYDNVQHLLAAIDQKIVGPAEERRRQGL